MITHPRLRARATKSGQRHRPSRRSRFEPLEERRLLAIVPPGFTETVVASGLTNPMGMAIADNGDVWFVTKDGKIRVIQHDMLNVQPATMLVVDDQSERGLLSITLDPNFSDNHYLYVYYTATEPQLHNRVSRLTVDPLTENTIVAGSELVLLDFPNFSILPNTIPIYHQGGALAFLEDGSLVVHVGEHLNGTIVQTLNSPIGKSIRMNSADGSAMMDNPSYNPADDNPAGGSDTTSAGWNGSNPPGDIDWNDYVWARGLRNPFSSDVDPLTGRYFIGDVGQDAWEEVNDATLPGQNFGWPNAEGNSANPDFDNPLFLYAHNGQPAAITGGAFYRPDVPQFGSQYEGMYFFSEFVQGYISYFDPADPTTSHPFITNTLFPLGIEIAPDGSLYYIERGDGPGPFGAPGLGTGKILKVQFAVQLPPEVVQQPADRFVSVGYDAVFTASASGTAPLQYQWQRHNGATFVDISGATSPMLVVPTVTLADDGAQFRVVVTNGFGSDASEIATLDVTTDKPPTAEIGITISGGDTIYRGGDTITFSGMATDAEDGPLDATDMTWFVNFHHNTHNHPFIPATTGIAGGQFVVPTNSETAPDVWYRVHLIVTDSVGLTTEVIRDVYPATSDFAVLANLSGVDILVDELTTVSPTTVTGVVNVQRTIEAMPNVAVDGNVGSFVQWLDGETARRREISTPENDTAYVALYEDVLSAGLVFVSDLVPTNDPAPNGWGPMERDMSNGEDAANDGNTISIGGVLSSKGLGVHPFNDSRVSEVRYDLGGAFSRFLADVGMDDEKGGGSVVFQVYGDGNLLFDSGLRVNSDTSTGQPLRVDVDVSGVDQLWLVVNNGGDGYSEDHADWGNARLIPSGSGAKTHVNFQTAIDGDTPLPAGYVADVGQVFGLRGGGLSYGWSQIVIMRDRNATTANDLYETHAEIPANQSRTWAIALANGTYAVTVAVGDAGSNDSNNTVTVEGESYWTALQLDNDDFAQQTKLVTVSDGRLTMTVASGSATFPAAVNFIEIIPVPTANPGANLFPFFAADVNLNGRLTLQDALDFAAGWGVHSPVLNYQERIELGDLDFDGDTDNDDWDIFVAQWQAVGNAPISLAALLNPIAGDYHRDGAVDSLDFNAWKSTFGSDEELAADGNGNNLIDAADYIVWRKRLGSTLGSGAAGEEHILAEAREPIATDAAFDSSSAASFESISTVSIPHAMAGAGEQTTEEAFASISTASIPHVRRANISPHFVTSLLTGQSIRDLLCLTRRATTPLADVASEVPSLRHAAIDSAFAALDNESDVLALCDQFQMTLSQFIDVSNRRV